MSVRPTTIPDREHLSAWRRHRSVEALRALVERYLPLVYAAALRQTSDEAQASDVNRAVFLVLARRARKLPKNIVLAAWLHRITSLTCRKLPQAKKKWFFQRWFRRGPAVPDDAPLWQRLAPEVDRAVSKLNARQQRAVLLHHFLGWDGPPAAAVLRISEQRVQRRAERGVQRLSRILRQRGVQVEPATLAAALRAEARGSRVPEDLTANIFNAIESTLGRRPSFKLARRVLNSLAWARWRRRVAIGVPLFALLLASIGYTAWYIDSLSGHSRSMALFLEWSVRRQARIVPGLAQPAKVWPGANTGNTAPPAAAIRSASDLYQTTNIWTAHLSFTAHEWEALQPKRIGPLPNFMQSNGTVLLRNPNAQRSGLAGVLGFDFNWAAADLEFGGLRFTNVAARIKGNGTYLASLAGEKRAFKVDLNRFVKGQKLAGLDELNFNNLLVDQTCMSDALGYEFFRAVGVPAPRTAYAYLSVSVSGKWESKPLGMYVMVEPVDERFAAEQLGSKKTPVFKPVTYELFEFKGDDWSAYEADYDLKTKATPAQLRRVVELAKLVSQADDAEFAGGVGEYLDLPAFARFLAGVVLLSNYDSFLSNGQNYYLYLDPESNGFGFIPWDLDLSWGSFFLLATAEQRERASIWQPWVGKNRFLERVMAVEAFRSLYRAELERMLAEYFVPERLHQRIDELAAIIRPSIAAESDFRLAKFDEAVGEQWPDQLPAVRSMGADRPVHYLKRFIVKRAASVRRQLDGKSNGVVLRRR